MNADEDAYAPMIWAYKWIPYNFEDLSRYAIYLNDTTEQYLIKFLRNFHIHNSIMAGIISTNISPPYRNLNIGVKLNE